MDSIWIKESFWPCFLTTLRSHYWTPCGMWWLLSHFHQPRHSCQSVNWAQKAGRISLCMPIQSASQQGFIYPFNSIILLFISFFLRTDPETVLGAGHTSETHTWIISFDPVEDADSVACAGLEDVLGAKEYIKQAPNLAFQEKKCSRETKTGMTSENWTDKCAWLGGDRGSSARDR